MKHFLLSAAFALAAVVPVAGQAATVGDCTDVFFSAIIDDFSPDPDQCAGVFVQNVDFTGELKVTDVEAAFGGDFMSASGYSVDIFANSGGSGTLVDPMAGYDYAFTFKSALQAFAVLFTADVIAANLNTDGDFVFAYGTDFIESASGGQTGLSNTQAWKRMGEMTDIPLPAAGWLLLAGIGGLAAMKRRKKA